MVRGAYHFARPSLPAAASASDQAHFFISTIGNTRERGDLAPALDLEVNGGLSPSDLITWTQAFVSTVQSLTGRVPIIYSYPSFWRNSMANTTAFTAYPLWLADYTGTSSPNYPLPGGWQAYTFWQYTSSGSVPGIQGNVDVSKYCCDPGSLSNLAFGNGPPAATDVYGALLNNSGSGRVEVHALAHSGHYSQYFIHAATAFAPALVAADWQFMVASANNDNQPDLFGIHLRNTASGKVEVHAVSAASGYQTWIVHAATALPTVPPASFNSPSAALAATTALTSTRSGSTAPAAIPSRSTPLSEASNYGTWILHSASALSTVTSSSWQFLVGDSLGSGDLIGISHALTGSGRTEVHALSRSSGYRTFTVHTATPLAYTSDASISYMLGDHDNDGVPDIYVMAMNSTGSGMTEVHVLGGSWNFGAWIEHAVTPMQQTSPSSWQFSHPTDQGPPVSVDQVGPGPALQLEVGHHHDPDQLLEAGLWLPAKHPVWALSGCPSGGAPRQGGAAGDPAPRDRASRARPGRRPRRGTP